MRVGLVKPLTDLEESLSREGVPENSNFKSFQPGLCGVHLGVPGVPGVPGVQVM